MFRIFAILILLFSASISQAETKLTTQLIEQWLASQEALESWGEKHEETLDAYENQNLEMENPFTISPEAMVAPLRKSGLYDQALRAIKPFGFDSMEQWASATLAITKTAAAIEFDNEPSVFDPSQVKAMLESANLSPEHKAMLENAIAHNQEMVSMMKEVSDSDKNLVRPFLAQISQLMEE